MLRSRLTLSFGRALELGLAMGDGAPPESQALVVPQDVHLILGGVEDAGEAVGEPRDLLRLASRELTRRTGTVVVVARRSGTLVLQAVVYDFARTPHAREADVLEALVASFEEARARRLLSLAVQPLGTAHLGIEPLQFLRLLLQVSFGSVELGTTLRQVVLVLPSHEQLASYETLLRQVVAERGAALERT